MTSVQALPTLPHQLLYHIKHGGGNLYHIEHFLGKNKIGQEIKMIVPTDNQHIYGVLPTFKPGSKTAKLKHTKQC